MTVRQIQLRAFSQLLLENKRNDENVTVKLLSGEVEIFGVSLVPGEPEKCPPGISVVVNALSPSVLEITGHPTDLEIIQKSTTMNMQFCYLKLLKMSTTALKQMTAGPIAMIVGPKASGKSTVCKMLANWAVRDGNAVLYVDLDPVAAETMMANTMRSFPAMTSLKIDQCCTKKFPHVFHYGFRTPSDNPRLYKFIVQEVATSCFKLRDKLGALRCCGMVINTCGLQDDSDYDILQYIAKVFSANIMAVVDETEKNLYEKIIQDVPNTVEVVYLPKSPAVSVKHEARWHRNYQDRIDEYFHGTKLSPLKPNCITERFNMIRIYQLRMRVDREEVKLVAVKPGLHLVNQVLSIGSKYGYDCLGIVHVTNVDMGRETITMLTTWKGLGDYTCLYISDTPYVDKSH